MTITPTPPDIDKKVSAWIVGGWTIFGVVVASIFIQKSSHTVAVTIGFLALGAVGTLFVTLAFASLAVSNVAHGRRYGWYFRIKWLPMIAGVIGIGLIVWCFLKVDEQTTDTTSKSPTVESIEVPPGSSLAPSASTDTTSKSPTAESKSIEVPPGSSLAHSASISSETSSVGASLATVEPSSSIISNATPVPFSVTIDQPTSGASVPLDGATISGHASGASNYASLWLFTYFDAAWYVNAPINIDADGKFQLRSGQIGVAEDAGKPLTFEVIGADGPQADAITNRAPNNEGDIVFPARPGALISSLTVLRS